MDEWVDSEFEDSPLSQQHGIGGMFSQSPNTRGAARKYSAAPSSTTSSAANGGVGNRTWSVDSYDGMNGNNSASAGRSGAAAARAMPPQLFQDVPVRMVPEPLANGGLASKRAVIRSIQEQSLQQLTMTCQAVVVRGVSGSYHVYHVEITSDYYKQKWIVCKRFSEFYRLRKKLLHRLAAHKKAHHCASCSFLLTQVKEIAFPNRLDVFQDKVAVVAKRTTALEAFLVALCQSIAAVGDDADDVVVCREITSLRFVVKEFLLFPLAHECQHVRAIRQLKYVDARDVALDVDACPICLCDWGELDGNRLVLAPCGHFFHEHCINEWYRTRFDCPMCRTIAGQE